MLLSYVIESDNEDERNRMQVQYRDQLFAQAYASPELFEELYPEFLGDEAEDFEWITDPNEFGRFMAENFGQR
jgi:hypothetical protein